MVNMIKRKQNQEKVSEEKDDESIIVASTPLNRNLRNVRAQQVVPVQLSPVLYSRAMPKSRLNKSKTREESESKAEVATKTDAATAAKVAEKPASQSLKNQIVNTNKPVEMVIDDSEDDVPVSPKRNVKVAKPKPAPAKSVSKKPAQKNNVVSPSTNPMPPPSNPVTEKLTLSSPLKRPLFEFTIPNKRPRIFIPEDFEDFDFFSDGDPPESEKNPKFELPRPRLNFDIKPEQELFAQPGQSTQNCYPKVNDFLVIDDENLHAPIQTGAKEKPTKTSNKSASPKNLKKGITAKKTKKPDVAPEPENDGSCDSEALHEEENVPVHAEPVSVNVNKPQKVVKKVNNQAPKVVAPPPLHEEENVPVHAEPVAVNVNKPQKVVKKVNNQAPKVVSPPPTNAEVVGRRTRSPKKPATKVQTQTKEVKKTLQSDTSEESEQSQLTVEEVVTSIKHAVNSVNTETTDQAENPLPKTKSKVLRQSNTASQKKIIKNEKITSPPPVEDTRTKSRGRRAPQPVSNEKSSKETEEEVGVGRRSQRSRLKPLKYWNGEHLQYKEDSKGQLEVVHVKLGTEESTKPDTKGRPRKDLYTVGSLLRKLASPADQMVENEDLPPDTDLPTLIHMKLPLNSAQPKKLTEIEVASEVRNLEAISKMEGTSKEDFNVRYSTTLDSSFVSCGYIRINAGASKGLQLPQNMTVFSLLTSSKLEVTINGEKINIGFGQHFWVPPGIAYDIKNISTLPSLLQFSTVDIGEASSVLGHKK